MPHQSNETLRKSLHIVFGFCAFALKWLPWPVAALVALTAIFSNWLLLHRLVGRSVARHERGFDAGIVLYPTMVLLLILFFRDNLHHAAVCWAVLAFGDGVATISGKAMPLGRLPWNRDKSWGGIIGFVAIGFAGAYAVSSFLSDEPTFLPRALIILLVVLAAATVESLALNIDDNITVPIAAAVALQILFIERALHFRLDATAASWLTANALLAIAGYMARSVDVSGMIGGFILGAILIVCGFPPLYLALLAFFILGTAATKLGYARKAREGLAQEKGGRRGFGHAFANVGVAAICALGIASAFGQASFTIALWWAAVASFATAAADTVASEVGQLYGKRTFLPLTFTSVPRGTEGAISVEGTVAGIVAAAIVTFIGVNAALIPAHIPSAVFAIGADNMKKLLPVYLTITLCAAIGSYIESIVGHMNRTRGWNVANGALNFFNTAIGAALAYAAASLFAFMRFE